MLLRRALVVLGILLTAGCTGGGSEDDAELTRGFTKDNITQRMTDAMVAQGSMHVDMAIGAGPQSIEMAGDLVFGKDPSEYKMSVDYSQTGDEDVSVMWVDGIIFANFGESSDDKFVRIDPEDATSPMGQVLAPMMDEFDITKSIAQFEDAITDVEQEGDDTTIDGVEATPFQVTIDADRAKASGALDEDSGIKPGVSIEYTFYLDADDLLRRVEFSIDDAEAQMDITGFGESFDIVAPPAAQVIDESEFQASA
jgi:hypothetical protein